MNLTRNLTAEGEMDYDYSNDILFFKVKNREYNYSLEFGNIVVDVDSDNFVTGIQLFDASDFLRTSKEELRKIAKWQFQASVNQERIEIRITFQALVRNKMVEKNPIIVQQATSGLAPENLIVTA